MLAQNLYYVRRLKFGITDKPIPPMLCLAAQNFAVLSPTIDWKTFYSDDAYDWDLAPSSPDKTLIEALHKSTQLKALQIDKK